MREGIIKPWESEYEDYLHDESRSIGYADSISFPTSEAEVIEVVNTIRAEGGSVTVQGARTGITGGAVPKGGHVMNLQHFNVIGPIRRNNQTGESHIKVQPGALLQNIYSVVEAENLYFPPDPTESTATIGGAVACNASGALSHYYGSTRRWIRSLRLILSDGSRVTISRGKYKVNGRSFSLVTEEGRTISGRLPNYSQPAIKSAAGYYVDDNMDLLDLFIGMEGTLGIVTEAELVLVKRPATILGLVAFLPSEEAALQFVRELRGEGKYSVVIRPVAIEYFDRDVLELLRKMKEVNPAFEQVPALPSQAQSAIYIEFHGEDEEMAEEVMLQVLEPLTAVGGSDEDTWVGMSPRDLEPLKAFRHAAPDAVNQFIAERKRECPELTKLGTDISVREEKMEAVIAMYRESLTETRLESALFGHIGDNHVHVNILPRNINDYERGKAMYYEWAKQVVAWGGSVSAEHGIGKLKIPFLELMYGSKGIVEMRELKKCFDPIGMFNPGNLFG